MARRHIPVIRDYNISREDSLSSDGFEELGPRSMLPNPPRLRYVVEGEVPDILYTLNHVGTNRRFLGRKSTSPFLCYIRGSSLSNFILQACEALSRSTT